MRRVGTVTLIMSSLSVKSGLPPRLTTENKGDETSAPADAVKAAAVPVLAPK